MQKWGRVSNWNTSTKHTVTSNTYVCSKNKDLTLSTPININQQFSITSKSIDLIKDKLAPVCLYRVYWE